MRRYNYIFDGTLKASHDFTYKYDPKDPFRLLSVDAKEYRSSTEEVDTTRREHSYAFDGNGNLVLQLSDLVERIDSASFADTAAMQVRQYLWDEDNHLLAINDNGFVSNYFYDAAGERTVKISAPDLSVFVNGAEALKNDSALVKFVGYVSPYLVVSNGGRYTKHIYAGTQRIASKVGDIEAFGADPRREEYAGANLKEVDFGSKYEQQTKALLARYDSLGVEHRPNTLNDYVGGQSFCCGEKELVSNNQTGDNTFETPDFEQLIFFYHPDHLGSTALVTDNDGNVVQSIAYIPYGEVFIEERNGTWNTPYLFNGKELDEETGLYYYGARYLNPTSGMWLSTDPLFEKYVGMSPYKYCNLNPMRFIDPLGMAEEETDNLKTNVVNLTTVGLAVKEKTIEDSGRRKIEKLEKSTPNRITSGCPGCKPKKVQAKEIKATDAKLAKVNLASNLLTGYCIIEKGRDIYKKGSMDWKDGYDCASIAVSTRGLWGAIASASVELYRQAGEWFIEKVQDFNSFFERNKVDIMSNMYYTGSPF